MSLRGMALATFAACAVLCFGAVGSANAANYVETPCAGFDFDVLSWDWVEEGSWFQSAECPAGYTFGPIGDAHAGDAPGEFSLETAASQIEGFSAYISRPSPGAEGVELGIQACRFADCGPLVTGAGGVFDYVSLQRDDSDPDVEIPVGANRIVARVRCTDPTCPETASVVLSGLTITRSDDTPPYADLYPTVKVSEGDPSTPDDDIYAQSFDPPVWSNGRINFAFEGDDLESHLSYLRFDVAGLSRCQAEQDYTLTVPGCEMIAPHAPFSIYASEVPDGVHTLTVHAVNPAGLEATDSIAVKTDVTNPARPAQFKVTPRFNDWVGSRDVKIEWKNAGETVETATQSGIVGYRYDVDPVGGGDNPPPADAPDPPAKNVSAVAANSLQYRFPSSGTWSVSIVTVDAAGNESQPGEAFVDIDDVRPAAPKFSPIAPINGADELSGRTISWSYDSVPVSGICGHDYAFSPVANFNPGEDPASPALPGDATEITLTKDQVAGLAEKPQRLHIRGYSCAGIAGDIARPQVLVDFTPPAITLAPAGGTVSTGEPVLIGAIDSKLGTVQSGVASVECSIDGAPVDCSLDSGVELKPGSNPLTVTVTDAAGNSTTTTADYFADATPPEGWFEQPDPSDPTLVRATARDVGSGLASAVIEFRAAGGGSWTGIGADFQAGTPGTDPVTLRARIPDDGQLPDGSYELRLRLRDSGGMLSTVASFAGGTPAGFRIPVRGASVITAGLTPESKPKSVPLKRLLVGYGTRARLSGRLTTADGSPIGGAPVTISSIQDGSPPRTAGTVTTAGDGSFTTPVDSGGTRTLVARFAGSGLARPTTSDVKLVVRGKISLKVRPKVVRRSQKVILRGQVFFKGGALPLRGKSVELEFRTGNGGGWKQTTRTYPTGQFQYAFSYPAKSRPVRFTVRAISTAEPGWAFDTGYSDPVRFVVKP